jgi:hypothetical protein
MWAVADTLLPAIKGWPGLAVGGADALIVARVPGLLTIMGTPAEPGSSDEVACQFRVIETTVTPMV